jgi:hypothetical protein
VLEPSASASSGSLQTNYAIIMQAQESHCKSVIDVESGGVVTLLSLESNKDDTKPQSLVSLL